MNMPVILYSGGWHRRRGNLKTVELQRENLQEEKKEEKEDRRKRKEEEGQREGEGGARDVLVADCRRYVGCADKNHTWRGGNRMRCLRTSLPRLTDLRFCPAFAPHSLATQLFRFLMCVTWKSGHVEGAQSGW